MRLRSLIVHAHRSSPRAHRPNRVRLGVQTLEARDVPATLDLSFVGAEATANGAILRQSDAVPTGDFLTFVRMQHTGIEQGYNSDARPVQFDEMSRTAVNHALKLTDIPTVTVGGVTYREFLLNVNEGITRPQVSLDELRIYMGDTGNLRGYRASTKQLAGRTAVYDMDGAGDVSVTLNANLTRGTGQGDAVVLVPDSLFTGGSYVYLYSKFGVTIRANGGAEEWGVRLVPPPPPPPTGPGLSGFVYNDVNFNGLIDAGEAGLGGVEIQLFQFNTSTNEYDILVASVITDGDGFYSFDGLQAGVNYALAELSPSGIGDGIDTIGSQGGQVSNDFFFDIVLDPGELGINNNFGEGEPPT
jgi:hypothetical protein